jgi:hypothetical protein
MTITIRPEFEADLRARALADGISVETYVERLIAEDRNARDELASLAIEGLDSGPTIQPDSNWWIEKHRRLDERLKRQRAS